MAFIQPLDAITAKAVASGTTVSSSLKDTDLTAAGNAAAGKDAALVFITGLILDSSVIEYVLTTRVADSGEGYITVEGWCSVFGSMHALNFNYIRQCGRSQ